MLNLAQRIMNASGSTSVSIDETPKKGFFWMIVDSAIVAGITAFTALASGDTTLALKEVLIAGCLAFFVQLAVERGVKK